jgi:hypothetical protein
MSAGAQGWYPAGVRASLLARVAPAVLALPLAACATLADAATGDENLPNAEAGPFRALRKGELGLSLVAPNAVDDGITLARDVAILDVDGDPATFDVLGYFGASANGAEADEPPVAIRRSTASDGRSFKRQTDVVLQASDAWEKGTVGAPSAVSVNGSEVWLYYAAGGGIGLAKSSGGTMFTKHGGPVLAAAESGWDRGAVPRSPGVMALADGGFAMFYEVTLPGEKTAIGEARSTDGVAWTRAGDGPVLAPGAPGDEAYDDAGVGAPCPVAGETASGRPLLWLYYAAKSGDGKRTIGLAGRFEDGPFDRGASPVFGAGTSRAPTEPSVTVFDGFTILFATQHRSSSSEDPAVAAGIAPAQAELPPAAED